MSSRRPPDHRRPARGGIDELWIPTCAGRGPGHRPQHRDTYQVLYDRGVPLAFKPFQFGPHIEHDQDQINRARHGGFAGHRALGAADYELVARGNRELFTFCMCAGGYVMPSVSEPGHFCTNGMSESRHDSPKANSGLVVTIDSKDVGSDHPLAGVWFQREAERKAFEISGDYRAPTQWTSDFLKGKPSSGAIGGTYPRGTIASDLGVFFLILSLRV